MKRAISKEYLLCCMNNKGKIRYTSNDAVYFTASCLVELYYKKYIDIKHEKVTIIKPLNKEDAHLSMMYKYIKKEGTIKLSSVINRYNFSVSNKEFKALLSNVKEHLCNDGNLSLVRKKTLFGKKNYDVANEDIVNEIIKQNKIDVLKNDEYGIILASLLNNDKRKCYSEREITIIKSIKKEQKENVYIDIISESLNNFILQIVAIISAFTISMLSIIYLNIEYIH